MTAEKILLLTQKENAGRALATEIMSAQIASEVVRTDDFDDFCDLAAQTVFAVFIADDPDDVQRDKIVELSKIRENTVIFLSSATLEKSAATVVLKPFRLPALLSVLVSAVSRFKNSAGADIVLGKALFRPSAKTVTANDTSIALTDKETALLSYFIAATAPVTKDALLRDVWGAADGIDSHTPETHIYALRQKLTPVGIEIVSEKDGYLLKY